MTKFYRELHRFARRVAFDLSDPGDEGCPAVEVKLCQNKIAANLPWLYVDYSVVGPLDFHGLETTVGAFREHMKRAGGNFISMTIHRCLVAGNYHPMLRFKVIYVPLEAR